MIKPLYLARDHKFTSLEDVNLISDLIADGRNLLWIDLHNPSAQELQKIAEEFELHPLAVEDASRQHQRPKVDEYPRFYFVVFYVLEINPATLQVTHKELDMFMGPNYLVTVHYEEIPALAEAGRRWQNNAEEIESDIGILLYSLIDTIVDDYFPVLDALVDRIEDLEDDLFNSKKGDGARSRDHIASMLTLKRNLLTLRRIASPERDLLNILTRRDSPIFSEHTRVYFQDIYDHIVRVTDTIDAYRDLLSSAVDANLAVISNDLNKVMRTLTAASIILMTDALIAGIYGMNFDWMPELKWEYGYFYCLGLMLVVSLALYFVFKRKNWF
jgi:magnesium transporter